MINCLIIDDEQHAIDILVHYVSQVPYLELSATHTNPVEAMQIINDRKIDLVFLDIHMPELSGIDFVRAMKGKVKIILTTAYSEFALESYELEVVDYLLKPIRFPRFLQAVQKAVNQLKETASVGEEKADDFIFVKTESKGKLLRINLADIDFIEAMKNYVALHRAGQKTLVYTSMKEIEEHLPKKQFMRVHKSFIIPVSRIMGIEGNCVLLKGVKEKILIGENYKADLMEMVKNKMIQ